MFGIFLFFTYYLQETPGLHPVMAGVAFLPMVGAIIVSANLANIVLLPRIGPKLLVAPGMLAAAAGLAWLTRIGVHSSYSADVLPPLLLASTGLGFVMSPSMNTGPPTSRHPMRARPRPWSAPASRSAARSARRYSTPWQPAPPPATWPATPAPG